MATDLPPPDTAYRRDPWRLAWRAVTSSELLAATLCGLGALILLSAALPQAPSAGGDLAGYSRWLALAQIQLGAAFGLAQSLGLFSVHTTLLFRALLGALGCALAARLVDDIEALWRGRVPPAPPERAAVATLDQPLTEIIAPLRRRFRLAEQTGYFVADHFPLANAARGLAALGGLIAIAGATLTATGGWRVQNILLGVGGSHPIGPNTPYTLRLDRLDANLTGQITLLRETEPVAAAPIASKRASHVAGLWIHLQEAGPAIRASAVISDEQPLNLLTSVNALPASELLLRFTPGEPEQFFAMPDIGWLARLSWQPPESFRVLLYQTRTGAVVLEDNLPPDGIVRAGNVRLTLTLEEYARLSVARDPGMWPTGLGWILGALGLLGMWIWPARRTWLRAAGEGQTEIMGDALPLPPSPSHPASSGEAASQSIETPLPPAASESSQESIR